MFEIDLKKSAALSIAATGQPIDLREQWMPFAPLAAGILLLAATWWTVDRLLDRSIRRHESNIAALESAVRDLADRTGKARSLYDTDRPEIYWSDELRMISEKLPDKAWLTQLRVTSAAPVKGASAADPAGANTVVVEGGVLSNPNEGNLNVIGKFIQAVQGDPRFLQSFSSINLESVQRSADPYALTFRLRLRLKG